MHFWHLHIPHTHTHTHRLETKTKAKKQVLWPRVLLLLSCEGIGKKSEGNEEGEEEEEDFSSTSSQPEATELPQASSKRKTSNHSMGNFQMVVSDCRFSAFSKNSLLVLPATYPALGHRPGRCLERFAGSGAAGSTWGNGRAGEARGSHEKHLGGRNFWKL